MKNTSPVCPPPDRDQICDKQASIAQNGLLGHIDLGQVIGAYRVHHTRPTRAVRQVALLGTAPRPQIEHTLGCLAFLARSQRSRGLGAPFVIFCTAYILCIY